MAREFGVTDLEVFRAALRKAVFKIRTDTHCGPILCEYKSNGKSGKGDTATQQHSDTY